MRACLPIALALLAIGALVAFGHGIDMRLSDLAFNESTRSWPLNHHAGWPRSVFYDGPKAIIVLSGVILLIFTFVVRLPRTWRSRREAVYLLLCLALVPAITGLVRNNSGVSCPYAIRHYGGDRPDDYARPGIAALFAAERTDRCWPSGHASGAFAFLAVMYLPRRRLVKVALTALVCTAGALMGTYQVLRGAHFASHVVVSFCIALIVVNLLRRLPFLSLSGPDPDRIRAISPAS
jgi:membrane-associated PAP2 superfamily phosphatase